MIVVRGAIMINNKTILIGLDGAPWKLINSWIRRGLLPNLNQIASTGVFEPLKSVIPLSTPVCWSSIYTGKNPGKHGVFEFLTRKDKSYKLIPVNASHRKCQTYWEILSEHGYRSIIVNAPLTYPIIPFNGILVAGWGTPSTVVEKVYPPAIQDDLLETYPGFNMQPQIFFSLEHAKNYLNDLTRATDDTFHIASHLIRQEWNHFFVEFQTTDYVQHYFWSFMDEQHPRYGQNNFNLKQSIFSLYRLVDDYVGKLVRLCDSNTDIMIISDHGMDSLHSWIHLSQLLRSNGYLKYRNNLSTLLKRGLAFLGLDPVNAYKVVQKLRLEKLRTSTIQKAGYVKPPRLFLTEEDVDWYSTKAYTTSSAGCVFLNQKGREPSGTFTPNKVELEELVNQLRISRDPRTKEYLFSDVYTKEQLYHGPYLNDAPDVVVCPNPGYGLFQELPIGSSNVVTSSSWKTGDHTLDGIFISRGPRINKTSLNPSILDIAPTLYYLCNVPIPRDVDGRVLQDMIDENYLKENLIVFDDSSTLINADSEHQFSNEEETEMMDRLRDLGYI